VCIPIDIFTAHQMNAVTKDELLRNLPFNETEIAALALVQEDI